MNIKNYTPSRAQVSRSAIQRLQTSMRHLFMRGGYKPLGVSGETMISSMLALAPEIYGSIADEERVELTGLLYIFQRLPIGIESCRYVKLISREGFEDSTFDAIVPSKRRRNCYKVDAEQMFIEMTRGRSDIFDVLTHLTFLFIESEKIRRNSLDSKNREVRSWKMLEKIIQKIERGEKYDKEVGYTYLSTLLGRTFNETVEAYRSFENAKGVNSLFEIVYWLGKRSMEEYLDDNDREINFSSALREKLDHHIYGNQWADRIKDYLFENDLFDREIHIISANLHSVMNSIYADKVLNSKSEYERIEDIAEDLSKSANASKRELVRKYALKNGMAELDDNNGTNISVQIFDCSKINPKYLSKELGPVKDLEKKAIIVMDYAFGQQAFETLDELLKPYEYNDESKLNLNVKSIGIMGKAGILCGDKGDIMIPNAHIFEGSADNYPFENALKPEDFVDAEIKSFGGPMITVLGTSLQNKDILRYFLKSSWGVVGLEMEGAHYQKAIQAASKIRKSISENVVLRYAYYASDNPLETGSTLASGSLGMDGVKPTYMITTAMVRGVFA
ncbi:MAG: hypothetical protein P1U56_15375 [Saprospiraceae bacterium]|nr:hypothetical protein [Saprospiraceae bacterium]